MAVSLEVSHSTYELRLKLREGKILCKEENKYAHKKQEPEGRNYITSLRVYSNLEVSFG